MRRRNYDAAEIRQLSAAFVLSALDSFAAEPEEGTIDGSHLAPLAHLVGLTDDDLAALRRDLNRHRARLAFLAGPVAGLAYRDMPAALAAAREE